MSAMINSVCTVQQPSSLYNKSCAILTEIWSIEGGSKESRKWDHNLNKLVTCPITKGFKI